MNTLTIAGLGEILFDVLPDGEQIGGAPMNFAYHVNALGACGVAVSSIGKDERGKRALGELKKRNLRTDAISQDDVHPTGYVLALVDEEGVAKYDFPDNTAWDHLQLNEAAKKYARVVDGVCFGTLGQRSPKAKEAIYAFLDAMKPSAIKVFDINLRQDFYDKDVLEQGLRKADVLKFSDEELPVLAELFSLKGTDKEMLEALMEKYCFKMVAFTRGGNGSLLVSADGVSEHAGETVSVVDTIGAGDSFTAATTLGLLMGRSLDEINAHANTLAAYVCTQAGAMPSVPAELKLL